MSTTRSDDTTTYQQQVNVYPMTKEPVLKVKREIGHDGYTYLLDSDGTVFDPKRSMPASNPIARGETFFASSSVGNLYELNYTDPETLEPRCDVIHVPTKRVLGNCPITQEMIDLAATMS